MSIASQQQLCLNKNTPLSHGLTSFVPVVTRATVGTDFFSSSFNAYKFPNLVKKTMPFESRGAVNTNYIQPGKWGKSFSNTATAGLIIPKNNTPVNSGRLSITCWLKPTNIAAGSYNAIMESDSSGTNGIAYLLKSNGKTAFYFSTTAGNRNYDGAGAATLVDNKWYHLALTYDGRYLKTYVNGVIDYSNDYGSVGLLTYDAGVPTCFMFSTGFGRALSGHVQMITTHDRALTWSEVRSMYVNPYCLLAKNQQVFGKAAVIPPKNKMWLTFD